VKPQHATVTAAAAALALVAALVGTAHASPIGPGNYDFATFAPAVFTHHPAHYGGWTQVLGDHDGDHRLDRLVYAVGAAGWRTWSSRSNGDGSFAAPVFWQAPGDWVGWTFATADVDGDGAQDLVLSRNDPGSARSFVARSLHDGTFAAPVAWERAGAFGGWTTLVADFTGDHRADLALCNVDAAGWHIALAMADGAGGFTDTVSTTVVGNHAGWHLGVGDFNGDGRMDLSLDTHDQTSWRTRIAIAAADRSFTAPAPWLSPGNYAGLARARGDFDADGRTDLLLWASDATSWRTYVARADGAGAFASPVAWIAAPAGLGWTLSTVDVNGDGGSDMVLQRADATGWQARVAVGSGGGSFLPPRPWGALAQHFGGWTPLVGDFSGDGRADLIASAVDALGWRAHVAVARGCQHVITPSEDFAARLAAIPPSPDRQTVCLAPGLYEREILIADKNSLSFIAPHGNATIATRSYAFTPFAAPGQDPGAPVQIWNSHGIELDGFEIRNLFTYQLVAGPDGELDQTQMVSRAVEILDSTAIKLSNNHLVGPGKQLLHLDHAYDIVVEASRLDCYYFCVDARYSTIELRRSILRAEHENPGDVHALLWTDHSSQRYLNCTMNMVTGKSLFAGVNDFSSDSLELAGSTTVNASAHAWVSQHQNYNGLNVIIRGSYPPLLDWYFIDWMGGGWQAQSQICYDPGSPFAHCVSHFE
jgi:hypothetical protein